MSKLKLISQKCSSVKNFWNFQAIRIKMPRFNLKLGVSPVENGKMTSLMWNCHCTGFCLLWSDWLLNLTQCRRLFLRIFEVVSGLEPVTAKGGHSKETFVCINNSSSNTHIKPPQPNQFTIKWLLEQYA